MGTCYIAKKAFGKKIFRILEDTGRIAEKRNLTAYLIGGPVRDLLLKMHRNTADYAKDLDIVISAEEETTKNTAIDFAGELFKIWSSHMSRGKSNRKKILFKTYPRFGTATILLPGLEVDFAFSRREKYICSGSLPEVEPGNIRADLYRRDFSINSLALDLRRDSFGELLDLSGGENDLKKGIVRVLHRKSFLDDPTRILRAARFAGRYDFRIEKKTLAWLKEAIRKNAFSAISRERFRREMIAILEEKNFLSSINLLDSWGALDFLSPSIRWSKLSTPRSPLPASRRDWLVNLLLLIRNLDYRQSEKIAEKLVLTREEKKIILETKRYLPSIFHGLKRKCPSDYLYRYLSLLPEQGLIYLEANNPEFKETITVFRRRRKKAAAIISGEDLKKIGFKPGPIYQKILGKIYREKIIGNLPINLSGKKIKEKEIIFVREHFPLA